MIEYLSPVDNKGRIQYIDALRGLAMLMVVFVHVEMFSFFKFAHTTILMKLLSAVHMPLFFFISGLCLFKPRKKYDLTKVKNDFLRLIMPAVIIGIIYTYIKLDEGLIVFFTNAMKSGYWFTISLFEILLIYYVINNLTSNKGLLYVLWTIAVFLYLLKLPFKIFDCLEPIGDCLCLHQTFNYFMFFVLGITVRKHKETAESLVTNTCFTTILLMIFVIAFFTVFIFLPKYAGGTIVWRIVETLGETMASFLGVLLLYVIFYKIQRIFTAPGKCARCLIIVGNNTLPIYLIHYFLLPNLPKIGDFLIFSNSLLIEIIVGFILSSIIIIVSIAINKLVMICSPFLGRFLLGNR